MPLSRFISVAISLVAWSVSYASGTLTWHLGTVDNRFGISRSETLQAIREAVDLWESGTRKHLFTESNRGGFPIDWVYDERSRKLQAHLATKKRLQDSNSDLEQDSAALAREKSEISALESDYRHNAETLESDVNEFNSRVNYWNTHGGATDDVRQKLEQEKRDIQVRQDALKSSSDQLRARQKALNQMIDTFNTKIAKHNGLVSDANHTNGRFTETVGVCVVHGHQVDGIHVFAFVDHNDLVRTLAHELGHALGLGHVRQVGAIMSAASSSEQASRPTLSSGDLQAFARLNR